MKLKTVTTKNASFVTCAKDFDEFLHMTEPTRRRFPQKTTIVVCFHLKYGKEQFSHFRFVVVCFFCCHRPCSNLCSVFLSVFTKFVGFAVCLLSTTRQSKCLPTSGSLAMISPVLCELALQDYRQPGYELEGRL
jgi:hypothetical protein